MAITVGVYLGKKDRFLRNWYDILPRGQFPVLVKYCIQAYLKGMYFPLETICDLEQFQERLRSAEVLSPTQRNVTFTREDGPVYDWVEGLENGYRSEEIKAVLKETVVNTLLDEPERAFLPPRQHLRRNLSWTAPEREGVPSTGRRYPNGGASHQSQQSDHRPEVTEDEPWRMRERVLKKEQIRVEEPYTFWEDLSGSRKRPTETSKKGEEAYREFSSLVDRMG